MPWLFLLLYMKNERGKNFNLQKDENKKGMNKEEENPDTIFGLKYKK